MLSGTPRFKWIAFGLLALLCALGLARMGWWQLDRAQSKQALLDGIELAAHAPLVELTELEAGSIDPRFRAVRVTGEFRADRQILLDNQLREGQPGVRVLDTDVPAIEAYPRAATRGLPVHRVEYRQPAGRSAPAALGTMRALAGELFPAWQERFALVTGRGEAGGTSHGQRA